MVETLLRPPLLRSCEPALSVTSSHERKLNVSFLRCLSRRTIPLSRAQFGTPILQERLRLSTPTFELLPTRRWLPPCQFSSTVENRTAPPKSRPSSSRPTTRVSSATAATWPRSPSAISSTRRPSAPRSSCSGRASSPAPRGRTAPPSARSALRPSASRTSLHRWRRPALPRATRGTPRWVDDDGRGTPTSLCLSNASPSYR